MVVLLFRLLLLSVLLTEFKGLNVDPARWRKVSANYYTKITCMRIAKAANIQGGSACCCLVMLENARAVRLCECADL